MAISKEIPIPYEGARNPDTIDPKEFLDEPKKGGNCEVLVHAIVAARGYELPRLRSSDIFEDTEFTEHIRDIFEAQTGDIIGLRAVGKKDFRGVHVGIIWIDDDSEIHVIHNAKHIGNTRLESLSEAMKHPDHANIAWVKRPIVENTELLSPNQLTEIGFEYLARTT